MHFGSFWVTVGASKPGSRAGARAHARARATAEQRPKLTFRRAWSGCRAAWGSGAGCGVPERATEVPRRRASSDRKDDPRAKAGGATSRPADSGSRVLLPAGTMARKNGAERARAEQRLRSRTLVRNTAFRAFGSSHHLCTFAHLLPPGLGLQLCSLPGSISPEAMPGRAGPEGGHMTRVVSCSAFRLKPAFVLGRGVHPDRTTRASRPHDPCIQTAIQGLCLLSATFRPALSGSLSLPAVLSLPESFQNERPTVHGAPSALRPDPPPA